MDSIIHATDSYKVAHHAQYPPGTRYVYSYFESRNGAKFPFTEFFGLQYIVKEYLTGVRVTHADIDEAKIFYAEHFGSTAIFNEEGWRYIAEELGGHLPIEIKAVPEGTRVPTSNVLMTVVNTDPKCAWLTNYVESLLTHVWYSSTVATLSRAARLHIEEYVTATGGDLASVDFMLHDFGYRGAASHEAAAIGGAGHLVNFMGTDTIPALRLIQRYYNEAGVVGFSVPATEHSVMTAEGNGNDVKVLDRLLLEYPDGILSVVADSFDIYAFTDAVVDRKHLILARDGRFVLRPDSVTPLDETPEDLVVTLLNKLWDGFGGSITSTGHKLLDTHVRVLWGDGIDTVGIVKILERAKQAGYAAENLVFGMGGGLLQKVNRDTQRFAFKCSAQMRDGGWVDIQKEPLDPSKKSKAGILILQKTPDGYQTVRREGPLDFTKDELQPVFKDGILLRDQTFSEIRVLASA